MVKSPSFADIVAKASKKYNTRIGALDDIIEDMPVISTGNLAIDHILGVGGFPLGRIVELAGNFSSGKAQRYDDVVHTPDRGFVPIRDLEIGDRLSNPYGEDSSLVGVFPQGQRDVYRLSFSDGTSAVASDEHLWEMDIQTKGFGFHRIVTTTEKLHQVTQNASYRPRDVKLPEHVPVEMDERSLLLDPYVMGALLGDGGMTDRSVKFTSMDREIVDRVEQALPSEVSLIDVGDKRGLATTYRISTGPSGRPGDNPVTNTLRHYGLMGHKSTDKFIPEDYLLGSIPQRLELLRGLMDTDGQGRGPVGGSMDNRLVIFYSSSLRLANDVATLVRSLGITAFVRSKIPSYYNDKPHKEAKTAYRVEMREPDEFSVFHLTRKKPTNKYEMRNRARQLVSVEYLGVEECVCIKVSAPSELYFTNDFIPTHNTTTGLQAAAVAQKKIKAGEPDFADRVIVYCDYEHALDPAYARSLGLDVEDPDTFLLTQPDNLEDGTNLVLELIRTGKVALIIFDSVAAMTPVAILEKDVGEATVAARARLMSVFLQKLVPLIDETRTSAVFINHLLDDMQMGGRPGIKKFTTPGGKALKFFASIRMEYQQIKTLKSKSHNDLTNEEEDMVDGVEVRIKVVKNKVGPPFRQCQTLVRFGKGFDEAYTAREILVGHKKIVLAPGRYYFFDKCPDLVTDDMLRRKTGTPRPYIQGERGFYRWCDEHPEWRARLVELAIEALATQPIDGRTLPEDDVDDVFDFSATVESTETIEEN